MLQSKAGEMGTTPSSGMLQLGHHSAATDGASASPQASLISIEMSLSMQVSHQKHNSQIYTKISDIKEYVKYKLSICPMILTQLMRAVSLMLAHAISRKIC